MARPALADLAELNRHLGREKIDENDDDLAGQADARLEEASEIVRAYAGRTWLNTDEDELEGVPGQIPGVVASMVERATRNPTGVVQEQAGPFGRSFGSDASMRLYLTKGEKLVVRSAAGRSMIGTVQLEGQGTPGVGAFEGEFAYDQYGGDPIPWIAEEDLLP